MKKAIYANTTLACTFQQDEFNEHECLHGVISKSNDGFKFEEAVKQKRHLRNPKLFNGNYCSLVHMQNGKYQIHMRTIDATTVIEPEVFASKVYKELVKALKIAQ